MRHGQYLIERRRPRGSKALQGQIVILRRYSLEPHLLGVKINYKLASNVLLPLLSGNLAKNGRSCKIDPAAT